MHGVERQQVHQPLQHGAAIAQHEEEQEQHQHEGESGAEDIEDEAAAEVGGDPQQALAKAHHPVGHLRAVEIEQCDDAGDDRSEHRIVLDAAERVGIDAPRAALQRVDQPPTLVHERDADQGERREHDQRRERRQQTRGEVRTVAEAAGEPELQGRKQHGEADRPGERAPEGREHLEKRVAEHGDTQDPEAAAVELIHQGTILA